MSQSDLNTQYTFNLFTSGASNTENFINFEFISRGEMDDAMAFALVDAMKGLAWPTGTTVEATVSKQDLSSVAYTTNPTATPPSFT